MADEMTPDDGARAADASPTVHVNDTTRIERGVDLIENLEHDGRRLRHRDVLDGKTTVFHIPAARSRHFRDVALVRRELVRLGEIDEGRDAGIEQGADLGARWRLVAIAGVFT